MDVFVVTKTVKFLCGEVGRGIVPTAFISLAAANSCVERMIEQDTEFSLNAEVKTVESQAVNTIIVNKPGTGVITYSVFKLRTDDQNVPK